LAYAGRYEESLARLEKAIRLDPIALNWYSMFVGHCYLFMERYEDPMYERFTEEDFDLVKGWGANNYPAILLERGKEVEMVSEGYINYEALKEDFEDILSV